MKKILTALMIGVFCAAAMGEEQNIYRFSIDPKIDERGHPDASSSFFHLVTPRKDIQINTTAAGIGLLPVAAAVMIPQRGLWDGGEGIFSSVRNLSQGQRNTVAGVASAGGLVTTSLGMRFEIRTDKKKSTDPVAAVEQSDLFPLLQKEFGAQKARDLIFARMVEGWSFKKIAEKFFKEPTRSKAVKMANEEYEALAGDKSLFGSTLMEQEAVIDAKVGQIVLMRLSAETTSDPDAKAAFEETLKYLRTEHKRQAPTAEDSGSPESHETHGNP